MATFLSNLLKNRQKVKNGNGTTSASEWMASKVPTIGSTPQSEAPKISSNAVVDGVRGTRVSSTSAAEQQRAQRDAERAAKKAEKERAAYVEAENKRLDEEMKTKKEAYVEKGMKDVYDTGVEYNIFGEDSGTPTTIDELVTRYKERQSQQLTAAQEEVARQEQLDAIQAERFKEQAQGSVGATTAAMAQGREGAMSGTAPTFASEFKTEMQKRMDENQIRLESAQAQKLLL